MNAPARPLAVNLADAVIVGAEITAAHDGSADLVIQVRYENGVVAPVVLDQDTAFDLMAACGAANLEALVGRSWRDFFGTTGAEGL